MQQAQILKQKVLNLQTQDFDDLALEIFRFQAEHNLVYKKYLQCLDVRIDNIQKIEQIPFLPIEFFKTQTVVTGENSIKTTFESSGTTGQNTSRHHVADPDFYLEIAEQIFEKFYEKLTDFQILALLPSYLERNNSSLVYMVEHFIKKTNNPNSGFFLNDYEKLAKILEEKSKIKNQKSKILLIGVTFGLLDFAESDADLSFLKNRNDLIVMETGGMKGRRKELLREEVHEILTKAFHVDSIHSEYGMTELLSQGYSSGEGVFDLPVSMKILFRDVNDPFSYLQNARTGGINVIDLANIDSCCFVETKDLGVEVGEQRIEENSPLLVFSPTKVLPDLLVKTPTKAKFKILGRFDNSDIRGCNLMLS
ncbi:MAG: acyl transferase [Arcicella sp.]|nr:acyl transferase [Arcicella sp.]